MIARTRLRSRKRSVSFRTLWWTVTRLGMWHQVHGQATPDQYPALARDFARGQTTPMLYKLRRHYRDTPPVVVR